jgi:hypothetical protein
MTNSLTEQTTHEDVKLRRKQLRGWWFPCVKLPWDDILEKIFAQMRYFHDSWHL